MSALKIDVSGLLKSTGGAETLLIKEILPPVEKGHEPVTVVGPVEADVILREAGGTVRADGKVRAEVEMNCARCLKGFRQRVEQGFSEIYRPRGAFRGEEPEEPEEEQAFAIEDNKIDLKPLLMQALVLAVPFKPLCRETCLGLCPVCGGALEEGTHDHGETEEEETGYKAVLKRYKEQHPEG